MQPVTLQPITSRLFSSHILEINNIYLMKNWDNVPWYLFMACTNAIFAVGLDTGRALYRHRYLHALLGQLSIHKDGQNGRHFTGDFFNCIFRLKISTLRLKYQWNLSLGCWLTINQHWFSYWLGAKQGSAPSHCLNQWYTCMCYQEKRVKHRC